MTRTLAHSLAALGCALLFACGNQTPLATVAGGTALFVDAASLYVSRADGVVKLGKSGGAATTLYQDATRTFAKRPRLLDAGSALVFAAAYGSAGHSLIVKIPKDGSAASVVADYAGDPRVAIAGGKIHWLANGALVREDGQTLAADLGTLIDLASDGTGLYVLRTATNGSQVVQVPAAGGDASPIATYTDTAGDDLLGRLAVANDRVVFTRFGRVLAAPKTGGSARLVVNETGEAVTYVSDLFTDGTLAVWSVYNDDGSFSSPRNWGSVRASDGARTRTLFDSPDAAVIGVSLDAANAYWIDSTANIYRIDRNTNS